MLKLLAYRWFGVISDGMLWCPWCEHVLTVNGKPIGWHFHCGILEGQLRAKEQANEE